MKFRSFNIPSLEAMSEMGANFIKSYFTFLQLPVILEEADWPTEKLPTIYFRSPKKRDNVSIW